MGSTVSIPWALLEEEWVVMKWMEKFLGKGKRSQRPRCGAIVAAAGSGKKDFQEKYIARPLEKALEERKDILAAEGEKRFIRVTGEEDDGCTQQVICPILCEGDVIGGVMILGKDEKRKLGETELKLASCAAGFLGRQMEQ